MTKEQIDEMNNYWWWHKIKLEDGIVTAGHCVHGTGKDVEERFGLPKDMTGMSVLDIGGWDGLFSFEAEKRNASEVLMIDIYQTAKMKDPNKSFQFAKRILNSKVRYSENSLESFPEESIGWNCIFYFGVLYHIENPLGAIKKLFSLVDKNGIILLETAICNHEQEPLLAYRPGHHGDNTNQFYPNIKWLELVGKQFGAKEVKVIYNDSERATIKYLT